MRRWYLATVLTAMAAAPAAAFDAARVTSLPEATVLERACDPPSSVAWITPGRRATVIAEISGRAPDRRALAWLQVMLQQSAVRPPFAVTLEEPIDPVLRAMGEALQSAGLQQKANEWLTAKRDARSIGQRELTTLVPSAAFGTKHALVDDIIAYVHRTPSLAACFADARKAMPDQERFEVLTQNMLAEVRAGSDPQSFPSPFRIVWLGNQYVGEVYNGGVDQFFSNSSGDDAPETVAALRSMGLADQAAVLEKAVALFGARYPTDRSERDVVATRLDIGAAIEAVTRDVHTSAIEAATLAYATREGLLPK